MSEDEVVVPEPLLKVLRKLVKQYGEPVVFSGVVLVSLPVPVGEQPHGYVPYTPTGVLAPYVAEIAELRAQGMTKLEVAQWLLDTKEPLRREYAWPDTRQFRRYTPPAKCIASLIYAMERRMGTHAPDFQWIKTYRSARRDHLWWLREQGLTYKEMGKRLGLSTGGARSIYQSEVWTRVWARRRQEDAAKHVEEDVKFDDE